MNGIQPSVLSQVPARASACNDQKGIADDAVRRIFTIGDHDVNVGCGGQIGGKNTGCHNNHLLDFIIEISVIAVGFSESLSVVRDDMDDAISELPVDFLLHLFFECNDF